MRTDDFEWDDAKADANFARHGVTFEMACEVFDDPFAILELDDRYDYGEDASRHRHGRRSLVVVAYTYRDDRIRIISARLAEPHEQREYHEEAAERAKAKTTRHDWSRVDAMTDAERHAAALADPDAQPLTPDDFKRMKRVPQVTVIRRAFRLSQEEFAAQFHIPIETLRDWEQGTKEPDAAAKAYLWVIASEPKMVREALLRRPVPR